jgi:hypothetical protein
MIWRRLCNIASAFILALAVFVATPAIAADPFDDEEFKKGWAKFWEFMDMLDKSWLGGIDRYERTVRPWNGKWPALPVVLYYEPGGVLHEHILRWRAIGATGAEVEIRGACYSACTMIVSFLPKERFCFDEDASLHFHAARNAGSWQVAAGATRWMWSTYPKDIRDWLTAKGGPEQMTIFEFWILNAEELWAMGYRKCAPRRAPMTTIR